jgi:hypothetical protein
MMMHGRNSIKYLNAFVGNYLFRIGLLSFFVCCAVSVDGHLAVDQNVNKQESSSSSSPLCRIFTLTYPKQTMSLGNAVLQLFCSSLHGACNGVPSVKYFVLLRSTSRTVCMIFARDIQSLSSSFVEIHQSMPLLKVREKCIAAVLYITGTRCKICASSFVIGVTGSVECVTLFYVRLLTCASYYTCN